MSRLPNYFAADHFSSGAVLIASEGKTAEGSLAEQQASAVGEQGMKGSAAEEQEEQEGEEEEREAGVAAQRCLPAGRHVAKVQQDFQPKGSGEQMMSADEAMRL